MRRQSFDLGRCCARCLRYPADYPPPGVALQLVAGGAKAAAAAVRLAVAEGCATAADFRHWPVGGQPQPYRQRDQLPIACRKVSASVAVVVLFNVSFTPIKNLPSGDGVGSMTPNPASFF